MDNETRFKIVTDLEWSDHYGTHVNTTEGVLLSLLSLTEYRTSAYLAEQLRARGLPGKASQVSAVLSLLRRRGLIVSRPTGYNQVLEHARCETKLAQPQLSKTQAMFDAGLYNSRSRKALAPPAPPPRAPSPACIDSMVVLGRELEEQLRTASATLAKMGECFEQVRAEHAAVAEARRILGALK